MFGVTYFSKKRNVVDAKDKFLEKIKIQVEIS
jgi:hypothetical protein